jgi:DNA-binding PadR family transcriptional regulator
MALREPSYFILAALVNGPAHGYGIVQEAAELSGGRVRLSAGTLYGALERLASEGLVEADREEVVSGRRRRYFRLTGEGESALAEESERMRSAAEAVETRLSGLRSLRSKGASA